LKEIIEEISRIDAIAYENEQQNKAILSNEKLRLENEIKKYREQKLEIANNNAKIIYNQIVINAKNEYELQEEKIKRISNQIAENYTKVEKDLIQEVFNKFFL
jgi:hypothetical protein